MNNFSSCCISANSTDPTQASTASPHSSSDPKFPLQWGQPYLGHSDTECGSSALMDMLKLITASMNTVSVHTVVTSQVRFVILTFPAFVFNVLSYFLTDANATHFPPVGSGSFVRVLCETVCFIWAPRLAGSLINDSTPRCLILSVAQSTFQTLHLFGY